MDPQNGFDGNTGAEALPVTPGARPQRAAAKLAAKAIKDIAPKGRPMLQKEDKPKTLDERRATYNEFVSIHSQKCIY